MRFVLAVILCVEVVLSSTSVAAFPLLSEIDWGSWTAWGLTVNSHGRDTQDGNAPLGFNNISGASLNQAWIHAGHEAQTGKWIDFGFRSDFLFGADGPDTAAFGDGGWDASWKTSDQYGFAMPQLYGEMAIGKGRIKVGRFFSILGYERVQAPENFFYSHTYTFYYNEPRTHTGILMDRPLGEFIQIYGGWTAGWDSGFSSLNDGSTFLGGASVKWTDNINITWALSFGDPGDDRTTTTDVYLQSLVFDIKLSDRWNYVLQSDFQTRAPDPAAGGAFKQYGISNYLFLDIFNWLSAGARYEWFYAGENVGPPLGPIALTPGTHYHAVTFGLNLRKKHLVCRPEVRYDFVDFDGPAGGPFSNGTRRSQATIGFQSVITF